MYVGDLNLEAEMRLVMAMLVCLTLVGCGQKGPLTMPGAESTQTSAN